MKTLAVPILLCGLVLSGCAEIKVPMAVVSRSGNGAETVLTGTLSGRIDGTSNFALASDDGALRCTGASDKSGRGVMECSDGQVIELRAPPEMIGKPSAAYATQANGGLVAMGWGRQADVTLLRGLLSSAL